LDSNQGKDSSGRWVQRITSVYPAILQVNSDLNFDQVKVITKQQERSASPENLKMYMPANVFMLSENSQNNFTRILGISVLWGNETEWGDYRLCKELHLIRIPTPSRPAVSSYVMELICHFLLVPFVHCRISLRGNCVQLFQMWTVLKNHHNTWISKLILGSLTTTYHLHTFYSSEMSHSVDININLLLAHSHF
jgi:hypothetical protein